MSRPQKIHKPIKGEFNNILASVAEGTGASKGKSVEAQRAVDKPVKSSEPPRKKE
jgi:hypothetical protein